MILAEAQTYKLKNCKSNLKAVFTQVKAMLSNRSAQAKYSCKIDLSADLYSLACRGLGTRLAVEWINLVTLHGTVKMRSQQIHSALSVSSQNVPTSLPTTSRQHRTTNTSLAYWACKLLDVVASIARDRVLQWRNRCTSSAVRVSFRPGLVLPSIWLMGWVLEAEKEWLVRQQKNLSIRLCFL